MTCWGDEQSRRRFALRRLLLCALFLAVRGPYGLAYSQPEGQGSADRIVLREVRITREIAGELRAVESLTLALDAVDRDTSTPVVGLPVLTLQDVADDVRGASRETHLIDVRYDPPRITLVGPPPREAQIVTTYTLPLDAPAIELRAALPTDELVVHIARGNIEARADRSLSSAGLSGSETRPYRRFVARDIPAETTIRVEVSSRRTDWRQRLAVVITTGLAATLAIVGVWRARPWAPESLAG